ncbi:MAG TPA: zinc ribbon domain-containing protein [Brevefilum sp.]
MPTYTYRCENCHKRFEVFLSYKNYEQAVVECVNCGSSDVRRVIQKVRIARSDDSRFEDMADPEILDGLEDDPKALGRFMRKMESELGEEAGPEFDEVVSRLEKGQNPEEIEKEMPGLMDNIDAGDDFDE